MITHQPYPSDVSAAEWAFVLPYLCLLPRGCRPERRSTNLRDVFDALQGGIGCSASGIASRTVRGSQGLPAALPPMGSVGQAAVGGRRLLLRPFGLRTRHCRGTVLATSPPAKSPSSPPPIVRWPAPWRSTPE